MARNPSGSKPAKGSGTQQMEAYTGPATTSAPPSSGNRRVGDDDRRGLAAFEKAAPPPASSSRGGSGGSSRGGSSRWSGGGESSYPPPGKGGRGGKDAPAVSSHRDEVDEELRALRLGSSVRDDEDDGEMVAVSATSWGDDDAPSPQRVKAARRGARRPEDDEEAEAGEEEEAPPRKKSSAWKWIGGTALLLAVGGGTAVGLSSLSKDADPAATADAVAEKPKPAASEEEEEPEPETRAAASDKEDKPDDSAKPDDSVKPDDAAKSDSAKPDDAAKPESPAKVEPAAPTGPEPWATAALAHNPWVGVPAAPQGKVLGLSLRESSDTLAGSRTGFRPAAGLAAPAAPYRIQSHEVTWGELALATTPPELAAAPRPSWVPADVKKAAGLPVTGVPWALARRYCQGLGGDLPSEAEWEWAARGPDDNYFPWGRGALDTNEIRVFAGRPVPVALAASSTLDVTPGGNGIHDLLGNAQEWTRDAWRPGEPSEPADARATTHKAVRGWPLADKGAKIPAEGATYRAPGCADASCLEAEAKRLERVGFRCMIPGT